MHDTISPPDTAARIQQVDRDRSTGLYVAVPVAVLLVAATIWVVHGHIKRGAVASPLPQVVVSRPLARELAPQRGFLGQFSAVDQVALRAQVGGTLTEIHFKDGEMVHKGDLLFAIDPVPYQIKLAKANARLETTMAQLQLANRELVRAEVLERSGASSTQNVEQRFAAQRAAQAGVDDAKAGVRDALFDLEHCRIVAPISGRIGSHLVSVGNLIAGNRYGTNPTTILATIVSLDPIYLNFDISEADYLAFESARAKERGPLADKVEFDVNDETDLKGGGTLTFLDNRLDPSSGTIHARATVSNPDLLLTSGDFARVTLGLGPPVPVLLVPDAAVLPDQSEHIVLTVQPDGMVVPKQVRIGDVRNGLRVIRSGLTASDEVIIEGIPLATPGDKVMPKQGSISFISTPGAG